VIAKRHKTKSADSRLQGMNKALQA
jgi:hypothetical protein